MCLKFSILLIFVVMTMSQTLQLYTFSFTLSPSLTRVRGHQHHYPTTHSFLNVNHDFPTANAIHGKSSAAPKQSPRKQKSSLTYRNKITTRKDVPPFIITQLQLSKTNKNDDDDQIPTTLPQNPRTQNNNNNTTTNLFILITPLFIAASSYLLFPTTFGLFSSFLSTLLQHSQQQPPPPQQEDTIITSTTTVEISSVMGVVMAVLSILYGNIISGTGFVLRQRRLTIHGCLNVEADQVRSFSLLLHHFPRQSQESIRGYLKEYVEHVAEKECCSSSQHLDDVGKKMKKVKGRNGSLIRIRSELNHLSAQTNDNNGNENGINSNILEQAYNHLDNLSTHRLERITALQNAYSPIHWINIVFLSIVITTVFLLQVYDLVEANNNSGRGEFLLGAEAFELRLVFSMLMGIFTMLFCIGYDLANPFVGSYQVPLLIGDDDDELFGLFND